jgi:hypothetical protein
MTELLVSISILLIISMVVAGDLNKTRWQEELATSARVLAGGLRDMQARALTASGVKTCPASGLTFVCEMPTPPTGCTGACSALIPPFAVGMTLNVNATGVARFAEVEPTYNNRAEDVTSGRETLGWLPFAKGGTTNNVTILSLTTNLGGGGLAIITFERQSGLMRVNPCDWPTGGSPPTGACSPFGEPTSIVIVIQHAKSGLTKTLRLNGPTGKISID